MWKCRRNCWRKLCLNRERRKWKMETYGNCRHFFLARIIHRLFNIVSHELFRWSSFSFLILTFSGFNYRTKISIEYITAIYIKSEKQHKIMSNFLNFTIDSCRKKNFHMGDCMSRGESEFYSAFHWKVYQNEL